MLDGVVLINGRRGEASSRAPHVAFDQQAQAQRRGGGSGAPRRGGRERGRLGLSVYVSRPPRRALPRVLGRRPLPSLARGRFEK